MSEQRPAIPVSSLVRRQLAGPSSIREIMKLAERQNILDMGLDPEEVISFAGGWVNHAAPAGYRQAYLDVVGDPALFHASGGYTPTLGTEECRAAVVAFEEHLFGVRGLGTRDVAIGLGSTQLTHDVFRTILDPGDAILVVDPTYANYEGQLAFAVPGARIATLPLLDPGTWTYLPARDPDRALARLERGWTEARPKAVLLCSPDNPTGQVVPQQLMDGIMERAVRDGAYVVIDFAYKCQCFVPQPDYFTWSPEERPNLVTIHSNSKWARGLGRRLGWVEAAPAVVAALERVQQCSILCPDALQQMTMARYVESAVSDGSLGSYVEETRRAYQRAAAATVEAIDRHLGLPRFVPEGGLYTVIDVGTDGDRFVREVLRTTGVLLVPGRGFGATLANGVRVSYGPLVSDPARIDEGLARVGRALVAEGVRSGPAAASASAAGSPFGASAPTE